MNTPTTHYAVRDSEELGDYYIRHVCAMTIEGLHAKTAIAAELAHRDREIDRLKQEQRLLAKLASEYPEFYSPMEAWQAQRLRDKINAEIPPNTPTLSE